MDLHPFLQRIGIVRPNSKETEKQLTGRSGENLAKNFLRKEKGFRVITGNWRHERDEIDLVCWDGDILVFVEVKTRAASALVPGYYAVDKRKKEAMRRVCGAYLKKLRRKPATFRFDVVEVTVHQDEPPTLLHFENIPLFTKGYHW